MQVFETVQFSKKMTFYNIAKGTCFRVPTWETNHIGVKISNDAYYSLFTSIALPIAMINVNPGNNFEVYAVIANVSWIRGE